MPETRREQARKSFWRRIAQAEDVTSGGVDLLLSQHKIGHGRVRCVQKNTDR